MSHRISAQAERDLDEVWYYIATESSSTDTADRLIDSITVRFLHLSNHPYLGRSRERDFGPGMRSFAVGEYVIVYAVAGNSVLILRVVHGRRDLETLFKSDS